MKKLRKLLVASLALTLSLTSVIPAFAQTDTTQNTTTTGTKESTVTINSTSSFKVTVPSTITVSQSSKALLNETYKIKVEGDINGTETIKVVPDVNFNLTQTGKSDIPVTVNQPKTEFLYDEINGADGCTTTGTLTTTNEVTAGTWTGNLTFNINVEENGGSTPVARAAGLYTKGTDTMIKSWDELLAEDTIHVNEGVLTSNFNYDPYINSSSDALAGDLIIDSSVTSLGDSAFESCHNLTSVTIPASVTTIGNQAFQSCDSLTSVTIPDSVTYIGAEAFNNCENIVELVIPDSVNTIDGIYTFNGILNIEYHGTAEGAPWGARYMNKYIEGDFLYEDSAKTTLLLVTNTTITIAVIPDSVTTIGDYAFSWCTSLTSITIPDSVTTIGDSAFYYCTSLTSINIPDSVTTIGNQAFRECTNLTSVTIPDSVTTIGGGAFLRVPHIEYHGTATDAYGNNWGAVSRN